MSRTEKIFFFLLFMSYLSYGQMNQYNYQRELKGISGTWQQLVLPDNMLTKANENFSDVRVYGLTGSNDTLEAPYLLRQRSGKISNKEIESAILNTSHNSSGFYFTFDIYSVEPVNNISLSFSRQNFDWKIKLEGSNDKVEWFTIAEDYRILSIKNDFTDYSYTNISFPNADYRFFRLMIPGRDHPGLLTAKVSQLETVPAEYREYNAEQMSSVNDRQKKETKLDLALHSKASVSYLKINVRDSLDYYRPVAIWYVTDSIHSEKGWKYNYGLLASGTLTSIEQNEFRFNSTHIQKLRVVIQNGDNKPLDIGKVEVKGYIHDMIIRINEKADYFLVYGNKYAVRPEYDIDRFTDKIPEQLNEVTVGDEQLIDKDAIIQTTELFKNKTWLWVVMTLIIILLGWFTLRMVRSKV